MNNQTENVYSAPRRMLHMIMALLMIAGLIGVELHEFFPRGSTIRSLLMSVHFQCGILIFLLVWPRILLALREGKPAITPPLVPWQKTLSSATHGVLYLAMIAMPVLGIMAAQAKDRAISLFGMELPRFVGVDKDFARTVGDIHGTFGNIVIALLILHIAAAIWHHRALKDDTLTRMFPRRN